MQTFKPGSEAGEVLQKWWEGLKNNKGDRAALRRCGEVAEVPFVPVFHDLYIRLRQHGLSNAPHLAAVVGLLAHIENQIPNKSLPAQMASPKKASGNAALSELRFRRLLQYQSREELFPALRRVVQLLDRSANIYSLANSVYHWNNKVRQEWAYEYYGALQNKS